MQSPPYAGCPSVAHWQPHHLERVPSKVAASEDDGGEGGTYRAWIASAGKWNTTPSLPAQGALARPSRTSLINCKGNQGVKTHIHPVTPPASGSTTGMSPGFQESKY